MADEEPVNAHEQTAGLMDWVHENCGGEISYQEYADGWFATCSNCDEYWDSPDMFNQVRRKDFKFNQDAYGKLHIDIRTP